MTHLWNYEGDTEPAGSMSIFPDHFAGRTGAVTALAGVLGRRLHGDAGFHVEVCQVEQVVNVMADLLAKESLEPGSVRARGNHHDRGTPWGLYPCSDPDSWVAVCTRSDAEWQAFVEVIGSPAWAAEGDLSTLAGRQAREAELDEHIRTWTQEQTVSDVVDAVWPAGFPPVRCTTHPVSSTTLTFEPEASSSNCISHRSAGWPSRGRASTQQGCPLPISVLLLGSVRTPETCVGNSATPKRRSRHCSLLVSSSSMRRPGREPRCGGGPPQLPQ